MSTDTDSRIDRERALYRPEVFENYKYRLYGSPSLSRPPSVMWLLIAVAVTTFIYFSYLTVEFSPQIRVSPLVISDMRLELVANQDSATLRRELPTEASLRNRNESADGSISIETIRPFDCPFSNSCSLIVAKNVSFPIETIPNIDQELYLVLPSRRIWDEFNQ